MQNYLIAGLAALGLTLGSSDLNSANAQFGYGIGVPSRSALSVNPYCPSRAAYGVGYRGYGYQRVYASPGVSLSVSRGLYGSPYGSLLWFKRPVWLSLPIVPNP